MNNQDLMLLITYYIFAPIVPNTDQQTFNDLVNSAIQYDYPLEKVWRLAMNYDSRGYNYDLIDEFFVNSKDSYYLAEYISGVIQVNKGKIVNENIRNTSRSFTNEKELEDSLKMEIAKEIASNKTKKSNRK